MIELDKYKDRNGPSNGKENTMTTLGKQPMFFSPMHTPQNWTLDLHDLHANIENYLNDFHQMIDNVFKVHGSSLLENVSKQGFPPSTRTTKNEKEYIFEIAMPWIKKEDIKVNISEDKLIVEGITSQSESNKNSSIHGEQTIYREFPLDNVVIEEASSLLENGVLKVTVPILKQREGPKMKQIEVK